MLCAWMPLQSGTDACFFSRPEFAECCRTLTLLPQWWCVRIICQTICPSSMDPATEWGWKFRFNKKKRWNMFGVYVNLVIILVRVCILCGFHPNFSGQPSIIQSQTWLRVKESPHLMVYHGVIWNFTRNESIDLGNIDPLINQIH